MMGLVLEDPLPTYPEGFPEEVLHRFEEETGRGILGNRPASGTRIIEELGPEQERTGAWILYTSADSVFQVAANTERIPLEELYEACEKAHEMLIGEGEIMVERVIARPFHGEPGAYVRENENRHDYGITPPSETYLDRIEDAGHDDRRRRQDPGHLRRQGHHGAPPCPAGRQRQSRRHPGSPGPRGVRPHLRQPRRFRRQVRPPPRPRRHGRGT